MSARIKGFTLIEVLIAMVVILFLGIALAKAVLDLVLLNQRVKVRQTAIQVAETWASYIEALPYESWIINPGENSEDPPNAGGNALYCYDCAFNTGLCSELREGKDWSNNDCQGNYTCSFFDPCYTPPYGTGRPYDTDNDGVVALFDPYHGNNNCKDGANSCEDSDKKYRYPSWYLAGHLRLLPDWGQGSDDCACRLGKCPTSYRIGQGWVSWDGSWILEWVSNIWGV
ncbi:MAG: prepilin-type N-terminal cleavage/methylation domain-containing protein [Aquificaceae bacterium]